MQFRPRCSCSGCARPSQCGCSRRTDASAEPEAAPLAAPATAPPAPTPPAAAGTPCASLHPASTAAAARAGGDGPAGSSVERVALPAQPSAGGLLGPRGCPVPSNTARTVSRTSAAEAVRRSVAGRPTAPSWPSGRRRLMPRTRAPGDGAGRERTNCEPSSLYTGAGESGVEPPAGRPAGGTSDEAREVDLGGARRVDAAERGCVGGKGAGDSPLARDAVQVVFVT